MAQGVVDFLEAVEVEQQNGALRIAAARPRERGFEQGQRMYPVGQAGEGVVLGLVADPLFAFGDAALHAVERIRQVGEFVVADHRQRLGIVAGLDPSRRIGQPPDRPGHAAAHHHRHHQRQQRRQRGQQHDLPFQVPVGLHRRVHARQQQHVDPARVRRIGRGDAGMEFTIAQRDATAFARQRGQLGQCVRGLRPEAAGHQSPALRVAYADRRVQAGQRAVVAGLACAEQPAHRHPADQSRRHHRHHHQRIRLAVQLDHAGAVALRACGFQQWRKGEGLRGLVTIQRAGLQVAVDIQQQRRIRTHPLPVVEQGGQHGRGIAGGQCLAEGEVRGQRTDCQGELLPAVALQLPPHLVAHVDALGQLPMHVAIHRDIHDQQRGQLHQQQDRDQHQHDACAETEPADAGHPHCLPLSLRNFSCSARSLSSAGATASGVATSDSETVRSAGASVRTMRSSCNVPPFRPGCQTRRV